MPPYRINPELIISFESGGAIITLPDSHAVMRIGTETLQLLAAILDSTGEQMAVLRDQFTSESLQGAISQLAAQNILVEQVHESAITNAWQDWGTSTWFFHLMSQNTKYAT